MLFLVHHAQAADPMLDPQRPLTDQGHAHAETLAARVAARGVRPAVIWHSGKLRARQTGEPFWRLCNPLAEFTATRGLQPDDPPQWIADAVTGDTREIMVVGHMPHLNRLLELLVGDRAGVFPLHGCVALSHDFEVRRDGGGRGVWREAWRE